VRGVPQTLADRDAVQTPEAELPIENTSLETIKNAIQIQIWVSMIAWLLMQVIKKQVKRKWSLSNMMTAVHILLNSYMGLYDFLNLPEGRWIKIIEARQKEDDENHQPSLFPEMRGPNFENQKTKTYLQQVTDGK
jgi:hypothetical protein